MAAEFVAHGIEEFVGECFLVPGRKAEISGIGVHDKGDCMVNRLMRCPPSFSSVGNFSGDVTQASVFG